MTTFEDEKQIILGKNLAYYYFRWSRRLGDNPPRNISADEMRGFLAASMSTRRVDVVAPWGGRITLFLHWSDGTDLDLLDSKIASDRPYYLDLDGVIVVTDMPVDCRNCHSEFLALTLEHSVAPVEDMVPRYRDHTFVDNCPNCGHKWRADVVEIVSRRKISD